MCWFCMGPDAQLGLRADAIEDEEEEAPPPPVQETGAPTASSAARATSMSSE